MSAAVKRKLSKRQLEILDDALEEIEASVGVPSVDIATLEVSVISTELDLDAETITVARETLEESAPTESKDDDTEFYDDVDLDEDAFSEGFDREDIEVSIDEFLTRLKRAGLIRKNEKGKLPSFAGVFDQLFGTKHRLALKAVEFEKFIKGYFGFIPYEKMQLAKTNFSEIKAGIEEELANAENR